MCRKLISLTFFVLLLGLAGSASAELVLRYTFEGGTADDRVYYYENADGKFFGDAKVVDDAGRGAVLELDGNGDYVRTVNSEVAEFSTESFSYAFWAKTSFVGNWFYFWKGIDYLGAGGTDLHGVNCYHDDSAWVRFSLYNYQFDGDDESKVRTEVPEANCVDGTWVHIACVRDVEASPDELRFYVNGKLEPPGTGEGNPVQDTVGDISNAGFLYIGCSDRGYPPDSNANPASFFDGMIDEFRAYNHALSDEELQRLASDSRDPNLASDPSPEDGSQNECTDVVLSWTAGENAVTHDVYFGIDGQDVKNATTSDSEYRDNQAESTYDAGSLETLAAGGTYFWRIDEVGASKTWKGDVWKFRINDGKAHSPDPADGARLVALGKILSWGAGCEAASHDVYFGTDFDDVSGGATVAFQGNQGLGDTDFDPCDWDPCGLDYSTMYYWRIDEVSGATTWEGNVWSFRTASAIVDPNLRVWYKLDETVGETAADSSGYEHHGELGGQQGTWDADGHYDGCILFDDDGHVLVPAAMLDTVDKGMTVSVWLNSSTSASDDNIVWTAGAPWEDYYVRVAVPDEGHDVYWRAGDDTNDVMYWDEGSPAGWVGSWNHFAFVKDESEGKMQIYLNGLPVAEKTGVSADTLVKVQNRVIKIGAEVDDASSYRGKIDDFRVYNYALSADEISGIFRGGNVAIAWGASPYNGEIDVPRDANLAWNPGDYTVSHDVYLGTDWDDVNDATTLSSVYVDRRDPCEYDPPAVLELDTTYYWRIDEVNDANTDSPWKGEVWKFTVANFLVIDDVESYNQTDNWISDTWLDGFENSTGAEVYVGVEPVNPAHGGEQSMIYLYYNDGGIWNDLDYYSEIEVDTSMLPIGSDWTEAGVKTLTLFFDGNSTNDANERMYVVLEDTGGTYAQVDYGYYADEDMNDIKREEWQQWDIALSDFAGVDANNIKKVYIGFGIRGNPNPGGTPGGLGIVHFDDIRLYLPKCVPWRLKPVGDFTDDCKIDIADVGEMAKRWLKGDISFDEYTQPSDANLVGHWKLDENGGSAATDSSGKNNHGVLEGSCWWVAGHDNSAVKFSGGKVLVPDADTLKPKSQVSATAWVYFTGDPGNSGRVVVKGKNDWEAYALEVGDEDSATFYVGDVNGDRYFADSCDGDLYPDDWVHLAGTYDGTVVRYYIDGVVVGTKDENNIELSQDPCGLAIGNKPDANDNPFNGTIDDVRVYSRPLTDVEIAWLASDGTGFVELTLEENLYKKDDPQVINFRDLVLLMDDYGEDALLWPPE